MATIMQQFENAPDDVVFSYATYRDSLVYLWKRSGQMMAGILETRNIAFGMMISWESQYIDTRPNSVYPLPVAATRADFEHYRVQVPPDFKE
jgi:hypothetical protein